jgi:hypothetical protein
MFHLFKLIGAIEGLKYFLPLQIDSVPVDQVKRLRRKIASGKKTIEPLIYKKYTG